MLDTSRPTAMKKKESKMPHIEHPLIKMSKEKCLDVALSPFSPNTEEGRSVAFEDELRYKSKKFNCSRTSTRASRSDSILDNTNLQGTFLTNVPESISIIEGNENSTRLPLFGTCSNIQSRASTRSIHGNTKNEDKISIDEISERFQRKLASSYYEIRKKFISNDPDRNGNVQKEALWRIIQQITGCEITTSCMNSLLDLWGFKTDKQIFSFTEINSLFLNKMKTKTEQGFIDPVSRQQSKSIVPSKMIASDVYELIKEKFRSRAMYLTDLFPESVESQKFSFNKTDLQNALYKIMIDLIPSEMEKLWLKFDPTKQGSIDGMKFLKQMGIISYPTSSLTPRLKGTNDASSVQGSVNSLEGLLKSKLRKGFTALRQDFQKKDINQTGFISNADFLQVLSDHDLNLEESKLKEFLSRCVITPTKAGIPYQKFLVHFQDRSEAGVTHKLLTNKNKKKLSNIDNDLNEIPLIEMKLVNIFQRDFLELLENFRKLDKYQNGSVELEDFRKILETQMNMKFTEPQFKKIVNDLPLNRNSSVAYLDFLKQFDTGNFSPVFFNNESDNLLENKKPESVMEIFLDDSYSGKSIKEIKNIIRQVFESRYTEIENAFNELDEFNEKVLNQELMHQLMKKLHVKPELTRGDIRSVWKTFLLNERQLLDFKELTRHFMYNKLTATFPNAKLCPPVKGDSDLMQRSKTLNAATDMLLDNLRSKIDIMYNDLNLEFMNMDKENAGEVSMDEFREILKELCIHLTDQEIQIVCDKFKTTNDKISYVELLKPFCSQKQLKCSEPKRKENSNQMKHQEIVQPNEKAFLMSSLHQKLSVLNQPPIRQKLKKIDSSNSGTITLNELKSLLLIEGVSLSTDEVYNLMSRYDQNLLGSINYRLLLQELQSNN